MKLWKISRDLTEKHFIDFPLDEYDSAVVAAETEEDARKIHPGQEQGEPVSRFDGEFWIYIGPDGKDWREWNLWPPPDKIIVEYLGVADKATSGVIVASYNAG